MKQFNKSSYMFSYGPRMPAPGGFIQRSKAGKYKQKCLIEEFMDSEQKRTGKRPDSCMISCPCTKCNPVSM